MVDLDKLELNDCIMYGSNEKGDTLSFGIIDGIEKRVYNGTKVETILHLRNVYKRHYVEDEVLIYFEREDTIEITPDNMEDVLQDIFKMRETQYKVIEQSYIPYYHIKEETRSAFYGIYKELRIENKLPPI